MKRVLVTGGAGFLGSHLCEELLKRGDEVICFDNFFTGRKTNIAHLMDNRSFELVRGDVTDDFRFEVDRIFNMACPASPVHYQESPIHTIRTSVIGVDNGLQLASRTGAAFLQASTSEVYGDPSQSPQKESYWGNVNTLGIRACYDEGKRCAETLCMDYSRQYGVKVKIARIFNTYGPRMRRNDGRVVSNFIIQALKNEDITVYGDGLQTRSFCYCDDMIRGLAALMETSDDITGPVNLGNPEEISMLSLARTVIELTGSRSKIIHCPLPQDDPRQRRPDISKAGELLSWRPEVSVQEGLLKTIEYFEKEL